MTAVLAPPRPARLEPASALISQAPVTVLPAKTASPLLRRYWPLALATVSLGVYIAAGVFMFYSVHYAIGDALARAEDARAVLFSRDPHLAAWGFFWPPGPVLLELPFILFTSPLNQAFLGAILSTATCGAATVLVLVKLLRRLGLSEVLVAALTVTYCLNPIVIFYAGNGMSEGSFYLAASVFLLGIVEWYQEGGPRPLILISMGLAATLAIRYEGFTLIPVVATLVSFREPGWKRRVRVASVVALPGIFVFFLWTLANWLIMGNPFYWELGYSQIAKSPSGATWLPEHRTLITGILYAAKYTWAFVPALLVVAPLLAIVVWSRRSRFWELATIVGGAAVFPGEIALLIPLGRTWGDPRYFVADTIFSTVVLGLAAREVASWRNIGRVARTSLAVVLVSLGAYNALNGTFNDITPARAPVEGEPIAFRAAFGLSHPFSNATWTSFAPPIVTWERFDNYMAPYLAKGQSIMVDTAQTSEGPLLTHYPKQWIIPSDRDFQKLAENFSGQFQWLLLENATGIDSSNADLQLALSSTDGGHWRKVRIFTFGGTIGDLYHWAADPQA